MVFNKFERVISVHKLAYQAAACDGKGSISWIYTPTQKKRQKKNSIRFQAQIVLIANI